jgi:hypothetical protein
VTMRRWKSPLGASMLPRQISFLPADNVECTSRQAIIRNRRVCYEMGISVGFLLSIS